MRKSWHDSPLPTPQFLPSKDVVAPPLRIVPALERMALFCRETGRFQHNVPAWEKSAFFSGLNLQKNRRSGARGSQLLSQAGTLFRPNSPKQGRCASPGTIRFSRRLNCSQARTLCKIGENLRLSRPRLSRAGTLCRCNSPKPGRCARWGRIPASGARFSPKPGRWWQELGTLSRLWREARFSAGKPGVFCTTSRLGRDLLVPCALPANKTAGQELAVLCRSPKSGPCSARTLPSRDVARDRREFLPLAAVFLPSQDVVPLSLSQAGTLCRIGANLRLGCPRLSQAETLCPSNSSKPGPCAGWWEIIRL